MVILETLLFYNMSKWAAQWFRVDLIPVPGHVGVCVGVYVAFAYSPHQGSRDFIIPWGQIIVQPAAHMSKINVILFKNPIAAGIKEFLCLLVLLHGWTYLQPA